MKQKYWTIENGQVTLVPPFSRGMSSPEVQASTKSEASAKLLTMAQKVLEFTPRIVIKNGAYLLIYSNGETLNADSGTFARTSIPLACETHKTIEQALESSSFKYYSSEDYRKADSEEKAKISA